MVCPKCGTPIKWYDLEPNCRKCGVHILYYTQEQDLARDAKMCELEFAGGRRIVAKLKKAYIQGARPITRLVLTVIAVAALLIPFGSANVDLSFKTIDFSAGALGAYSLYSQLGLDTLKALFSSGIAKNAFFAVAGEYLMLVLILLADAAVLIELILTFISLKKGTKAIVITSAIGAFFSLLGIVSSFVAVSVCSGFDYLTAKAGFGGYVCLAFALAQMILNIIMLKKKDYEFTISENDEKRIELKKKIKAGEITYDDLPLPIFVDPEKPEKEKKKKKKKDKKNDGEDAAK